MCDRREEGREDGGRRTEEEEEEGGVDTALKTKTPHVNAGKNTVVCKACLYV